MAGQAGKKAAKAREQASNLYYPIVFIANFIFFLSRGDVYVCRIPVSVLRCVLRSVYLGEPVTYSTTELRYGSYRLQEALTLL